ncbi:MAG: AAA family ATP:ADP antiporter [Candidatus Azotimanducaceae bacterium]|jgi:AAA family ATP:ADP antiporter
MKPVISGLKKQYQVAFLMAVSAMFTLAGYEFVRSASTVLFKEAYGAENLPLVMAAMPVVVFLGIALYNKILSELGPRRTLVVTSLGSGLIIFCCYILLINGSKAVTPFLYLTKELYIVLLIEQYWSYINSSLSPSSAKKLNGPITGIAGIGSALGGTLVGLSAGSWGTETMVLISALFLLPAVFVANYTYQKNGEPVRSDSDIGIDEAGGEHKMTMGWTWLKRNPTLAYLLAIVLLSQLLSAVLDLKFQSLLSVEYAGRVDEETAFQGWFWGTLNSSVLILQFIIVPMLLSFVALRWIHVLMPVVHLFAIGMAVYDPTIFSVGLAFFLFKAFDYSLFRAAKEMLYVPLSFDERYRTKQIIDVLGYRTGKGASSVIIVLLQRAGVLVNNYYLAAGFAAVIVWLVMIFPLTKHVSKNDLYE